ncbi:MarR family transcriptional regulator [Cytobacillus sp.]|uniref:MarR family winged helix-turn-helix transcriptional regulator n=1 Tax=Cytobacillus sp. TaxID=2675269 RepID=UPI0028BE09E9|nr:MarR family transcriptional regulator [Cytobacillus sp.]
MQKENQEAVERIEYELTTLIRRAVYLDISDKKIGHLERSVYLLLRHLDECGPSRLKALAETFNLDISTLSRQASAIEAKGYITRFSDPTDGRVSLFKLTDIGMEKLITDKNMRIERYHAMLDNWSNTEKEIFGELLERMNEALID